MTVPRENGSGDGVVVTGLGVVAPPGRGLAAFWDGLASGRTSIGEVSLFDTSRHRTRVGGEVRPIDAREPRGGRGGPPSRTDSFALAAARLAIGHAGLPRTALARAGVFLGSSTGGMFEGERVYAALTDAGRRERARVGRLRDQPLGCAAESVARAWGVRGPVETVCSACAASTMALEAALSSLRLGECEVAIAGGADALCELTYGGFNSLRAVSDAPCRPFRADRSGLSLGEGAGILVLETEASARAGGRTPLAELAGAGSSCDAHHMTAPDPGGTGAALALRAALNDAGVRAEDVDLVSAHGTGTPHNEAAEFAALESVFGARAREIAVTATKGATGHLLGACGAVEAVAVVAALGAGAIPPTSGSGAVDDACPVDLVEGAARPIARDAVAVSLNMAFGGANSAVVLRGRPEPGGERP